jgi:hypothetical protein
MCRRCLLPRPEPRVAERDRYQRWWLERFSLEEIRELAAGIVDLPSTGSPPAIRLPDL